MWKRWLSSCQEKIFGHGPGVPFQCSAVRECHAFELSGVIRCGSSSCMAPVPYFSCPVLSVFLQRTGKNAGACLK
ncbi:hypothetical protein C1I94_07155 [Akkermansia muciniphila]|nr:hypothetical protein CUC06_06570 [Akkermansia muciniphila]PNC64193.1 hypothetical protein CXU00_10610 [Akkermansia muciniphila]PNC66531.1 hypothetical protein CXT99_08560 [Akkermansia muciniphila]PNC69438.1 hypothetical protein CXU04_11545 [Akkermansia muciniphila]QAA38984.1 hypothetical protein C1I90_06835 [Akkermansia muciniphila]